VHCSEGGGTRTRRVTRRAAETKISMLWMIFEFEVAFSIPMILDSARLVHNLKS
jgi:hypothetical protein